MSPTTANSKKSGFAVLVGRSNVGKSTLLNSLVGTKVAITSPKPQTTRQSIHGVVHDPRGQAVLIDTPGVFEKAHQRLTKRLNAIAAESLRGVDLILYVADPSRAIGNEEHIALRLAQNSPAPKLLVINKSDLADPPYETSYLALAPRFERVIRVSALKGRGLKPLLDAVFELLPEGEPIYPEFQVTNLDQKFWIAELIREKVFVQLHAEIPYSTAVEVKEMEKRPDGVLYISAVILTNSPRYKGMIVGRGGTKVKEIGSVARRELEQVLLSKVYLELAVEVDERWLDRLAPAD